MQIGRSVSCWKRAPPVLLWDNYGRTAASSSFMQHKIIWFFSKLILNLRLFDLGGAFSANEKKAKNPAKVSGEQKKGPGKASECVIVWEIMATKWKDCMFLEKLKRTSRFSFSWAEKCPFGTTSSENSHGRSAFVSEGFNKIIMKLCDCCSYS